jgi:lysophospholipase L1-like esterase
MVRPATALLLTLAATAALSAGTVDSAAPEGRPASMVVLGDSWSAGYDADPAHTLAQDAADDLGMTSTVDAQSGTGYLTAPPGTQPYPQRAAALAVDETARLVVLQGGSNDDGADPDSLSTAVSETVSAARRAFPRAQVVILGPGPDPWPIDDRQRAVDTALAKVADREAVPYISPMREGWFTAANIHTIIDPANAHPTVRGHELLGRLLANDLRKLLARHSVGGKAER